MFIFVKNSVKSNYIKTIFLLSFVFNIKNDVIKFCIQY